MVAYRDGFDTAGNPVGWTVVTTGDLKAVTFMAHDAYSVTVVCDTGRGILTWQSLRAVADDVTDTVKEPVIDTPCTSAPPVRRQVTGTFTQGGSVQLDDADAKPTSASPDFTLSVPDGTFDLVASTDLADPAMNQTLIRRGVTVSSTSTTVGTVDASGGLAQAALSLSLDNPPSDDPMKSTEIVTATVDVKTKPNATPARVSQATYNLTDKAIKLYGLPSAMLLPTDTQSATFSGSDNPKDPNKITTIATNRSITKPFVIGDDTETGKAGFSLPSKIAIPGWRMDAGRLSVALPTLPTLDTVSIVTSQQSGANTTTYEIDITQGYFDSTALARPVFDTSITGFKPEWKINFNLGYDREVTTEHDTFDDGVFVSHETSQFFENVPAPKTP